MDKIIYLDHAAATPLDNRVLDSMIPYMTDFFYNPSSPYAPAVNVLHDYLEAKKKLASLLGVKSEEIIITAGATESINLAFNGISGSVLVAPTEHKSVLASAAQHEIKYLSVDKYAMVELDSIRQSLDDNVEMISVALANNELGTIQPISDIAKLVEQTIQDRRRRGIKQNLYLHCDASQGAGLMDINISRLGVDLLTLNASKIYGPKQVGLLWVNKNIRLKPLILGGGQESGLRSGTENVAGTVGFMTAYKLATDSRQSEIKRTGLLRDYMVKKLSDAFDDMVISTPLKHSLNGHLHVSFPGIDAERIIYGLEMRGVLVATGSACAANRDTKSHVLEAIKMPDDLIAGSLRISLGKLNNAENIAQACEIIIDVIKSEYQRINNA